MFSLTSYMLKIQWNTNHTRLFGKHRLWRKDFIYFIYTLGFYFAISTAELLSTDLLNPGLVSSHDHWAQLDKSGSGWSDLTLCLDPQHDPANCGFIKQQQRQQNSLSFHHKTELSPAVHAWLLVASPTHLPNIFSQLVVRITTEY